MKEQPTKEQIKEFWEWYGVKGKYFVHDTYGEFGGRVTGVKYPPIDLNSLFKWAVPKLQSKFTYPEVSFEYGVHGNMTVICRVEYSSFVDKEMKIVAKVEDKDVALALFWALWKVRINERT